MTLVLVGTYTEPLDHVPESKGKGVHVFVFDKKGALAPLTVIEGLVSPAFLCRKWSPGCLTPHLSTRDGTMAYGVSERYDTNGTVFSIRVHSADAKEALLCVGEHQSSEGTGTCYLSVDPSGDYLLTANYMSGSTVVHPIHNNGSLAPPASVTQHDPSLVVGTDPTRQEAPHAHCFLPHPTIDCAYSCDLGSDSVFVYQLVRQGGGYGSLVYPGHTKCIQRVGLDPGAGPRHVAVHPNGTTLYVVAELASALYVCQIAEDGQLAVVQCGSSLPDGYQPGIAADQLYSPCIALSATQRTSHIAEVQVHPSGKFVYASNRGHDSISCFHLGTDGKVEGQVAQYPSGGKTPRHFSLDPSGDFLIAANQ
eukprot:gene2926-3506_t